MIESFILSHFALRQLFTQIQICTYCTFLYQGSCEFYHPL